MRRLLAVAALGAALIVPSTGVALAATSPNGPGQPGAPGTTCGSTTSTGIVINQNPGGSTTLNNNSVFNGGGTASAHYAGNPGTASLANANSPLAVSQYDIACFQAST